MSDSRWRVPLPRSAARPFRVFVNGIEQHEGRDFVVAGDDLLFDKVLAKERIGVGSWVGIFLGLFGRYGKNDSVDVQYTLNGRTVVATRLEIYDPEGKPARA